MRRAIVAAAVLVLLVATGSASGARTERGGDARSVGFFTPGFNPAAKQQFEQLRRSGDRRSADLIAALENTAHAVWVTKGTPDDARAAVQQVEAQAAEQKQVPVLVAYDIPGRDCGGLSAGGAQTLQDYEAWIDGFAAGIAGTAGKRHGHDGNGHDDDRPSQTIVILEPDGLGLLPSNCGGPSASFPFNDADRFAELNHAVDELSAQPNTSVYLDGTHSAWLSVGDVSSRLARAGLQRAAGFFLNVSNYRTTSDLQQYGTWISKCVAFANDPEEGGWRLGHYDFCASQYFSPFGPVDPNDSSTWHFVDDWYNANMGTAVPSTHFVVDTSRNGQGPWHPTVSYPDPQDWCNPPNRGLGLRPTAATGNALIDAFLWVKVPGESDGSCNRGIAGSSADPEWAALTGAPGFVDPAAGAWFPQQALQLAQLASPPLTRGDDD